MAGSIYQLPTISADTNAGTGAMSGASQSFSHAGTIFGELRKSILDEEQRAIDNAFKEKQFAENIRQFDTRLGWEQDKFSQEQAWNREKLSKEQEFNYTKLKADSAYQQASLANQAFSNKLHAAQFQWQKDQILNDRNAYNQAFGEYQNERKIAHDYEVKMNKDLAQPLDTFRKAEMRIAELQAQVDASPNAEVMQNRMDMLNEAYATRDAAYGFIKTYQDNNEPKDFNYLGKTPYEQDMLFRTRVGQLGGNPMGNTPFTGMVNANIEFGKTLAIEQFKHRNAVDLANINNRGTIAAAHIRAGSSGGKDGDGYKGLSMQDKQNALRYKQAYNRIARANGLPEMTDKQMREDYLTMNDSFSKFPIWGKEYYSNKGPGTDLDFKTYVDNLEVMFGSGSPEDMIMQQRLREAQAAKKR